MEKSLQLQIRLSPRDKRRIEARARQAGLAVSAWVLGRLLPSAAAEFERLCERLAREASPAFVYAALNDFLSPLSRDEFVTAVADAPTPKFDPERLNYLAAMIEQTAVILDVAPPDWTRDVPPLEQPVFASDLENLRLHLLINALPSFRRRNLFVDTSIGGRV
ncbi:MAG: hypothetical protein NT024_06995 [Proteobacteria bacterium]|nr:hypothetical protein [Pseudomonadota bacterium]